jgi:hypothetical protein
MLPTSAIPTPPPLDPSFFLGVDTAITATGVAVPAPAPAENLAVEVITAPSKPACLPTGPIPNPPPLLDELIMNGGAFVPAVAISSVEVSYPPALLALGQDIPRPPALPSTWPPEPLILTASANKSRIGVFDDSPMGPGQSAPYPLSGTVGRPGGGGRSGGTKMRMVKRMVLRSSSDAYATSLIPNGYFMPAPPSVKVDAGTFVPGGETTQDLVDNLTSSFNAPWAASAPLYIPKSAVKSKHRSPVGRGGSAGKSPSSGKSPGSNTRAPFHISIRPEYENQLQQTPIRHYDDSSEDDDSRFNEDGDYGYDDTPWEPETDHPMAAAAHTHKLTMSDLPLPAGYHGSLAHIKRGLDLREERKRINMQTELRRSDDERDILSFSASSGHSKFEKTVPKEFTFPSDVYRESKQYSFRKAVPPSPSDRLPQEQYIPAHKKNHVHMVHGPAVDASNSFWMSNLRAEEPKSLSSMRQSDGSSTVSSVVLSGPPTMTRGGMVKYYHSQKTPAKAPAFEHEKVLTRRQSVRNEKRLREQQAAEEEKARLKSERDELLQKALRKAKEVGAYTPERKVHSHQRISEKYSNRPEIGIDVSSMTMSALKAYKSQPVTPIFSPMSFSSPEARNTMSEEMKSQGAHSRYLDPNQHQYRFG